MHRIATESQGLRVGALGHSAGARDLRPLRVAVTLRPQALGAEDIAPWRNVGMNDETIIELLHAVAIFGWANRLTQYLGEPAPFA